MAHRLRLLVEGQDDWHALSNLLNQHELRAWRVKPSDRNDIGDKIAIEAAGGDKDEGDDKKGGVDRLLKDLTFQLQQSDQECVGIVVDADENLEARWQAVCTRIEKAGSVTMPAAPDPAGTIVALEQPDRTLIVGVWLMPENTLPGMIEDFLRFLIPKGDSLLPRAEGCLADIPEEERLFAQGEADHSSKALMHTWLAWQDEPGRPLGQAVTQRYLDAHAPHAVAFVDWARRLFNR